MASIQRINNFIDGKFVSTESYLESFNPSTEEVNAYIADSSVEDANRAVQAARQAFPTYVNKTLKDFCFENFFFLYSDGVVKQLRSEHFILIELLI